MREHARELDFLNLAESPVVDVPPHLSGLRRPRLFLHFFDTHFLQEKGVARFRDQAYLEARLATRLAVMLADEVIVPAASYKESELCARIFGEFSPDVFGTQIVLTGGGSSLEEFIEDKRLQYHPEQAQGRAYRAAETNAPFPWRPRGRSATADIIADWRSDLSSGATEHLFRTLQGHLPPDHERLWEQLPERLGSSAFIIDNILPHLFGAKREVAITVRNRLHGVVNRSYFGSFAKDNGAAVFRNMAWLESPGPVPSGDPVGDIDFRRLEQACRRESVLDAVRRVSPYKLLDLREDPRFVAAAVAGTMAESAARLRERAGAGNVWPGWRSQGERAARVECAPEVLLVTALPREGAAVEATFDRPATRLGHRDDPFIYKKGSYALPDGTERTVLLATLPTIGTDNAAVFGSHALRTFSVKHILMVGIAGGCPNPAKPDEHVRLGDVVVSDKGIMDYGNVTLTRTGPEYRSPPQAPSAALLGAFRTLVTGELLGQRPWEGYLERALARENLSPRFARPAEDKDILHATGGTADDVVPHPADRDRRPGIPRVFGGVVGTADILLKEPRLRDELRDKFGMRAIEMEGSGLQTAAWVSGRDVIVVRGICDYCDPYKNDDWQFYAALAAAAYARALVEVLPAEWFGRGQPLKVGFFGISAEDHRPNLGSP